MNENPLVSVNILSFNRKDELRNTLQKVYEQDYKNIEVIVVDNASNDGSADMIKLEFPDVQLIQLEKNIGIAGWNEGFKVAKGEYVLVLDDDAYPDKSALGISVELLKSNSSFGAIAFNIYNVDKLRKKSIRFGEGWLPKENIDQEWPLIVGCTFLMRRKLFIQDMFSKEYFICFHELPIINIIMNNGYTIFYSQSSKSTHNFKIQKDYNAIRDFYHFRNMVNFIYWQFPKYFNIRITLKVILFYFTRSLKYKWFINYLKAIYGLQINLMSISTKRLSIEAASNIVNSGIINYRFLKKFKK